MFWDKKSKGEKLPDLPSSTARFQQSLMESDYSEEPAEVHELPSFPDSPMQRGFSQTAIKEAIAEEEPEAQPMPIQEAPVYNMQEVEDWASKKLALSTPKMKEHRPVFVRLDKYQAARTSLETIKLKLGEVEELLKKIRDIKSKEDQELASWESDLENIKGRVQTVLEDIFDKTEY